MTAIDDRGEILTVGRLADDLRETGFSWPEVVEQLGEDNLTYVQRAHRAYRAHADEQAHRNQGTLF